MRREHETGAMLSGGAVLALGLVVVGLGFLWPLTRVVVARWWRPVPCVIESCELTSRTRRDDHDAEQRTWDVLARYRYRVDGIEYLGERFELGPWQGGGLPWREAALDRLRRSDPPSCWVDPDDPRRAVLERGFDPSQFIPLVGLVPMAIGGFLAGLGLRWRRQRQAGYHFPAVDANVAVEPDPMPVVSRMVEDPIGLDAPSRPRRGPPPTVRGAQPLRADWRRGQMTPIGALIVFALAYGLVLRHVCALIASTIPAPWAWLAYAPPVVIAAGFAGIAIVRVCAARAPRAELAVEPAVVWPGVTATARWRLPDGVRVDRLTIELVGQEVLLHRGSGVRREVRGLVPIPLAEVVAPVQSGAVRFTLPAAIMPSFAGHRAQVLWSLAVHLDIPNAPDGLDRYALEIHPCPPEAA